MGSGLAIQDETKGACGSTSAIQTTPPKLTIGDRMSRPRAKNWITPSRRQPCHCWMMQRAILITLASIAALPGLVAADEIVWQADRPLAWSDFRGRVSDDGNEHRVASTTASLGWTYGYEVEWSDEACTYRITDILSSAVFLTAESWVKPDHRAPDVLAHEQGHFDIAEIYRRAFEAETRPFVSARASCTGQSRKRVTRFIASEIEARLGTVYESIWAEFNATQERYDAETEHGIAAQVQRQWIDRIAGGLGDPASWRTTAHTQR